MTHKVGSVGWLIEKLSDFPQDATVIVCSGPEGADDINSVQWEDNQILLSWEYSVYKASLK